MITLDSVLKILNGATDILIVWFMFYYILKSIKNNVKLTLIFKGLIIILLLKLVSSIFKLTTV